MVGLWSKEGVTINLQIRSVTKSSLKILTRLILWTHQPRKNWYMSTFDIIRSQLTSGVRCFSECTYCRLASLWLLLFLLFMVRANHSFFYVKMEKPLEGSISEKKIVTLGDVNSVWSLRRLNKQNPLVLFLHGGSDMPKYFLNEKYSTGLANNFVVCYLETDAHFP